MADGKLQEWILETIDQLRKRKARPDLERICHMVERRHGISALQTQAEIERLVDGEIVIKVDYKGNTSYRNAAKWGKKNTLSGQVLNSNDASRSLVDAVRRLEEQTAAGVSGSVIGATGVHIREIEKYLMSENAQTKLTKSKLQVALEREVLALHLRKLPTGNYSAKEKPRICAPTPLPVPAVAPPVPVAPSPPPAPVALAPPPPSVKATPPPTPLPPPIPPPASNIISPAPFPDKPPGSPSKKGRPTNKRKRFKKTHGPDFVENYDSSFEEPEPKCDYCLLTAACNYNGKQEDLLFCKDCNAKAHPSCMDYSADLAMRSRMSPWQCMDCKTCFVCDDSGDADSMLFCDACDKGYHMSCHAPKVSEKPIGKWVCSQCTEEIKRKKREALSCSAGEAMEMVEADQAMNPTIDGPPGLPTPCESPVPEEDQNKRAFSFFLSDKNNCSENKENDEIPDASNWTIDDVENYFKVVGFPEQALAFKDQEIDGKSLLLLKRSDVLTGLSIKLGPALKIYNHVKRLQTRRSDGHLIC